MDARVKPGYDECEKILYPRYADDGADTNGKIVQILRPLPTLHGVVFDIFGPGLRFTAEEVLRRVVSVASRITPWPSPRSCASRASSP